jgi:hypothetical protein
MIHRDVKCVFVGSDMASAVVTASYLSSVGIPARVMDQMTLGGFEGLTAWWPGVSLRGVEVWVDNPVQIEEARRLLAEHKAELEQKRAAAPRTEPVEVVCEECGKTSTYPPKEYGTTQVCRHCGAYVDVGDIGPVPEDEEFAEEPEET